MSDPRDIVERLRDPVSFTECGTCTDAVRPTAEEAAAEIERLRNLYDAAWAELASARLVLESKGSQVSDRRGPADVFRSLPVFVSWLDDWKEQRAAHDAARKAAGL
jgi:hypothetical protein